MPDTPIYIPDGVLANPLDADDVIRVDRSGKTMYTRVEEFASDPAFTDTYATSCRWPVFQIDLDGGSDPTDTENYIDGTYSITTPNGGIAHEGNLRLRGRGNSTWGRDKKPWRINFDDKTAPLGMTASQKNWALLANDLDPSKIANAFALDVGARMSGLGWTPEYRVVELVLNDTFRGLYMLADLVRMEEDRVPGDEDESDGSEGSWLLEVSNKERPESLPDAAGFATSVYDNWVLFDTPEAPDETQADYIADVVDAFEAALAAGDWDGWKQIADATSFADWYLINEVTRNSDSALWSSCKLWKGPDGATPGPLQMGPLWDFDLSLSVDVEGNFTSPTGFLTRDGSWFARMWQDAAWRSLLQDRWEALTEVVQDLGGLALWIDRRSTTLEAAVVRDNLRWEYVVYPPYESNRRKVWLTERFAWLDAQISPNPSPVPSAVSALV